MDNSLDEPGQTETAWAWTGPGRSWTIVDVFPIDPSGLRTATEFGTALKRRTGGRSLNEQVRRFDGLRQYDREHARPPDRAPVSRSTIGQVFKGERLPSQPQLRIFLRSAGDDPAGELVVEAEVGVWEGAAIRIGDGRTDEAEGVKTKPPEPVEAESSDPEDSGDSICVDKLDDPDDGPPTRMREVHDHIMERQRREYAEATTDIFKELARDPSRDVLIKVLRTATDGGLITNAGVRMPVWETELHYRYVLGDVPELRVNLESDDQTVLSTATWEKGTSPEDFYWQLVELVRAQGADLGVGLNDPTESIEHLSSMLVEVAKLRSQQLMGHRYSLANIIEHKDGWYFTERYIIPGDEPHYTIDVSRLNEMDWEEHLHGKRFDGAHNIPFARRMYGVGSSEYDEVIYDDETGESINPDQGAS